MGNYSSTLSILKVIAGWFEKQFPSGDEDWGANSSGRRTGGRNRAGGRARVESRDSLDHETGEELLMEALIEMLEE